MASPFRKSRDRSREGVVGEGLDAVMRTSCILSGQRGKYEKFPAERNGYKDILNAVRALVKQYFLREMTTENHEPKKKSESQK